MGGTVGLGVVGVLAAVTWLVLGYFSFHDNRARRPIHWTRWVAEYGAGLLSLYCLVQLGLQACP